MKNKKIFIILGVIVGLIVAMTITYFILLTPSGRSNVPVTFVVNKGDDKKTIINNLKEAKLIKSKYAKIIYVILSNNKNLQAGSYEFSRDLSTQDIIKSLGKGDVIKEYKPSARVTLKEGVTLKEYIKLICDNTDLNYDDAIKKVNDKSFLKGLIADYWFLTDSILNKEIYYPLEGYLYPDTYYFRSKEVTISEIFKKMLDQMSLKLTPYKENISNSNYNIHELLTLASIAEKEVSIPSDRSKVVSVFINRLNKKISLGSDITARYGVKLDDTRPLKKSEYNDNNPYNTRLTVKIGFPAGPICTISSSSIEASINPADTNYLYFLSNIKTKETFFFENSRDFENKKNELKQVNGGY